MDIDFPASVLEGVQDIHNGLLEQNSFLDSRGLLPGGDVPVQEAQASN